MQTPSPPKFHTKQCFISNNMPREPWEPPADGIVVMVGYRHYLVMFYTEADRRYAGPKAGFKVNIEEFDRQHHEVTCPRGWVQKEAGKKPLRRAP